MKNIDIFVHEKYNKADYEKVAEHIYKTYDDFMKSDCFVTSLKFVQEPELGEGVSPRNISQYPLEDVLDKFYVAIQDFYEDLNYTSDETCYLEFSASDMEDIADKVFAFTDDGRGVQSANVMYEAMLMGSKLNKAIVAHCEDNSLIRGGGMHEGKRSAELGIKGIPSICESTQIARDILLAEAADCHYHVCHISAKESVRAVREGKKNNIRVTCEVTPHHLLSCDEDIKEDNGMWKMNPPLRGREDRNALIAGILDGTIDIIATDHAPHTMEEKIRGIEKSSFGIVGSETAFAQLYTKFVKTDIFSLEMLVKLMSENVAKIFNLPYGKLEESELEESQPE